MRVPENHDIAQGLAHADQSKECPDVHLQGACDDSQSIAHDRQPDQQQRPGSVPVEPPGRLVELSLRCGEPAPPGEPFNPQLASKDSGLHYHLPAYQGRFGQLSTATMSKARLSPERDSGRGRRFVSDCDNSGRTMMVWFTSDRGHLLLDAVRPRCARLRHAGAYSRHSVHLRLLTQTVAAGSAGRCQERTQRCRCRFCCFKMSVGGPCLASVAKRRSTMLP